jgi:hypothetical protein
MKITICVSFFEGKGHCFVSIIPSDYEEIKYTKSECYFYELASGSYEIALNGVSGGRVVVEVLNEDNEEIGRKEIKREGVFQRSLFITI